MLNDSIHHIPSEKPLEARIRLGMLTPSSNTVLEPLTVAMTAGAPRVSSHFQRFRVTRISMDPGDLGQFETENIVQAAELLADAKVNVIGWSGTSGSWLGQAYDEALCSEILERTGIRATTSVLAMNEILSRTRRRKVGLVTPYTADVQQKIIENYAGMGIDCSNERHLNDPGNYSFAQWSEEQIADLIYQVAAKKPDAIMVMCTNFRAAPIVDRLERETGIPIYDSIAAVVWKSLSMANVEPGLIHGWGSLFQDFSSADSKIGN
ncbi:maleate isomerase [Pararhizobium capsulatum DSM 1112]|uniref:Maleate isomerase n=1 Tax=Pararhizobium capsulatum DSM 1112 TaxID=1121113 RepID=A0ABU0C1Q0_9HYPH|nr:aspartate/glutamate racemase family protein [Pararhizobium capsulatum]MDQ0323874.1 maleate isomerase [Pararhizobium capsulatum DSM 1112]